MILLLFISRLQRSPPVGLDPHEVRVVSLVARDRLILYFNDTGRYPVQEEPVMRNEQHPAGVTLQESLQPFNHADVQMVRRLVEKKEIRFTQQCLCQADARALPAGKMRHVLLKILVCEAEAKSYPADTAFIVIAAQLFKAFDNLAVGSQLFRIMLLRDGFLHVPLFFSQRDDIRKRPLEFFIECSVSKDRLLLNVAYGIRTIELNSSAIVFLLPHETAHERSFPRTIRSYEANLVPARNLKLHIVEQLLYAKGLCQPYHPQHSHIVTPKSFSYRKRVLPAALSVCLRMVYFL